MKNQAYIKTGLLPEYKISRSRIAQHIRKDRSNGFSLKRFKTKDGFTVYQSNDKYSPYLYAIKSN